MPCERQMALLDCSSRSACSKILMICSAENWLFFMGVLPFLGRLYHIKLPVFGVISLVYVVGRIPASPARRRGRATTIPGAPATVGGRGLATQRDACGIAWLTPCAANAWRRSATLRSDRGAVSAGLGALRLQPRRRTG